MSPFAVPDLLPEVPASHKKSEGHLEDLACLVGLREHDLHLAHPRLLRLQRNLATSSRPPDMAHFTGMETRPTDAYHASVDEETPDLAGESQQRFPFQVWTRTTSARCSSSSCAAPACQTRPSEPLRLKEGSFRLLIMIASRGATSTCEPCCHRHGNIHAFPDPTLPFPSEGNVSCASYLLSLVA